LAACQRALHTVTTHTFLRKAGKKVSNKNNNITGNKNYKMSNASLLKASRQAGKKLSNKTAITKLQAIRAIYANVKISYMYNKIFNNIQLTAFG
jgi:hypothetical protein